CPMWGTPCTVAPQTYMDAVPLRAGWNSRTLLLAVSYRCRATLKWYGSPRRRSEHPVRAQRREQAVRSFVGRQRVDEGEPAAQRPRPAVGLLAVADHERVLRRDAQPLDQQPEDPRLRFDHTLLE